MSTTLAYSFELIIVRNNGVILVNKNLPSILAKFCSAPIHRYDFIDTGTGNRGLYFKGQSKLVMS